MSLSTKYIKSRDQQWCMRFKTHHPDGDSFDGIVTHVKRHFIVLRELKEFEFDGIVLLPKKWIKGYRDDKFDHCCNAILRHKQPGFLTRSPKWLDGCESIPQVIRELVKRDIWPGIEVIDSYEGAASFYLGPINSVGDASLSIKCYDAAGDWEKDYDLDFAEIIRIEIESTYCTSFNNYMRSKGT